MLDASSPRQIEDYLKITEHKEILDEECCREEINDEGVVMEKEFQDFQHGILQPLLPPRYCVILDTISEREEVMEQQQQQQQQPKQQQQQHQQQQPKQQQQQTEFESEYEEEDGSDVVAEEEDDEDLEEELEWEEEINEIQLKRKSNEKLANKENKENNGNIEKSSNDLDTIVVHDVKVYKPRIRKIHPSRLHRSRQLAIFMCVLLVINLGLALCNLSYIHLLRNDPSSAVEVNGGWSSWYIIGDCFENCKPRKRFETRQCNNPAPSKAGKWCVGNVTRIQSCGEGTCRGCYPCKTPPNDLPPYYYCDCREILPREESPRQAKDCKDIYDQGLKTTGIYRIYTTSYKQIEVFCDKGWTVFQRRLDGSVNFLRTWSEYKTGFGELGHEFWLGNEMLNILTKEKVELKVTMEDWNGNTRYAQYQVFRVENESSGFRLFVSGYSGNAGDSLTYHNNSAFTTIDRDNDNKVGNCAETYSGGFWYNLCHDVNLNGKYYKQGKYGILNLHEDGIHWKDFDQHRDSLKKTEMKLRRV